MIDKMKQTSYLFQDLLSEETSLFPSFDISVSEKNICFKVHTLTGIDVVIDISDNLSRSIERHGLSWAISDFKSTLPEEFSDKLKTSLASIGYTKHSLTGYVCCDIFVTIGPIVSQINPQFPNPNQPNSNKIAEYMSEAYRAQLQSAMGQQQRQFQDGLVQMNKLREQQRSFMNPNNHGLTGSPLSMLPHPEMSGMSGMNNPINPYLQSEFYQIKQTQDMLIKAVQDLHSELNRLQIEVGQFKTDTKIED